VKSQAEQVAALAAKHQELASVANSSSTTQCEPAFEIVTKENGRAEQDQFSD
jgi:hypothetical protein